MDQRRWKEIDVVFEQMLEIDPRDRAISLMQICADDDDLRRRVEALLIHEVPADDFLNSPAIISLDWQLAKELVALAPGQQIGHYQIKEWIGAGGMGEVWRAWDQKLDRDVAIKILPPEFSADADRVRRFEQEAHTISRLNHPNILTIYEVGQVPGEIGDLRYIATELVEGQTLRKHLTDAAVKQAARMELPEAIEIAMQIAGALATAHRAGIIHRDIKPENVMLRTDGYVKVLDFGLAKLAASQTPEEEVESESRSPGATVSGVRMGTVRYMSPEQARGASVDEQSDIFSLGVVLYEMIASRRPFEGEDDAVVIAAILNREPPPLAQAPKELRRIVARAIEKRKEQRYRTAAEMHRDLQSSQKKLARAVTRRRDVTTLALATTLIALVAAGVVWKLWRLNNKEPVELAPKIQSLAINGQVEGADISPDGQHIAYTVSQGERRSIKIWHLATSSEVEIALPPFGCECLSPTFAPDGQSVYYIAYDEKRNTNLLYQAPVNGGLPREILAGIDSTVAVSPDGRQLVFVREIADQQQTSLMIANSSGGDIRQLTARRAPLKISTSKSAWSPDGKYLAFAAGSFSRDRNQQIYRISAEGGTESALSAHRLQRIRRFVWLKDNSGLVMLASDPNDTPYHLWVLSFAGDRLRQLTDFSYHDTLGITASGNELIAVKVDEINSLWVMPGTDDSHARQLVFGQTAGQNGITWTPDNKIIYSGGTATSPQLWIMNPDGSGHRRFSFGAEDDDAPSITGDGRYVVFSSIRKPGSGNQIWRMDRDGGNLRQLTSGTFDVDPKVSPDGKWVVYVSWDGQNKGSIWMVPIDGGQSVQLTADHTTNPTPAFSPDGKLLAFCHRVGIDRGRRIEVVPFDDHLALGRQPIKTLLLPETSGEVEWALDGRALIYTDLQGLVANIWRLPLNGGPRRQLTNFQSGTITNFAWSLDGKQLAVSRMTRSRDLVRISDFK